MPRFRRMKITDLAQVMEWERKIFNDAWTEEHFRNELNNSETSYPFVMFVDEKFVGYGVVFNLLREIHINNVAVIPDFRGQGFGAKMIKNILEQFPEHEEAWLEVRESNFVAINLYQKFNFKPVYLRKGYYSDGENALIMRRIA